MSHTNRSTAKRKGPVGGSRRRGGNNANSKHPPRELATGGMHQLSSRVDNFKVQVFWTEPPKTDLIIDMHVYAFNSHNRKIDFAALGKQYMRGQAVMHVPAGAALVSANAESVSVDGNNNNNNNNKSSTETNQKASASSAIPNPMRSPVTSELSTSQGKEGGKSSKSAVRSGDMATVNITKLDQSVETLVFTLTMFNKDRTFFDCDSVTMKIMDGEQQLATVNAERLSGAKVMTPLIVKKHVQIRNGAGGGGSVASSLGGPSRRKDSELSVASAGSATSQIHDNTPGGGGPRSSTASSVIPGSSSMKPTTAAMSSLMAIHASNNAQHRSLVETIKWKLFVPNEPLLMDSSSPLCKHPPNREAWTALDDNSVNKDCTASVSPTKSAKAQEKLVLSELEKYLAHLQASELWQPKVVGGGRGGKNGDVNHLRSSSPALSDVSAASGETPLPNYHHLGGAHHHLGTSESALDSLDSGSPSAASPNSISALGGKNSLHSLQHRCTATVVYDEDFDTDSGEDPIEAKYTYPRPPKGQRPPRIVREGRKQYNVGRPNEARRAHRSNGGGVLSPGPASSNPQSPVDSETETDDDEDVDVVVTGLFPSFNGQVAMRYENGTYNVGTRNSKLMDHFATNRQEYVRAAREELLGGKDRTPSPVPSDDSDESETGLNPDAAAEEQLNESRRPPGEMDEMLKAGAAPEAAQRLDENGNPVVLDPSALADALANGTDGKESSSVPGSPNAATGAPNSPNQASRGVGKKKGADGMQVPKLVVDDESDGDDEEFLRAHRKSHGQPVLPPVNSDGMQAPKPKQPIAHTPGSKTPNSALFKGRSGQQNALALSLGLGPKAKEGVFMGARGSVERGSGSSPSSQRRSQRPRIPAVPQRSTGNSTLDAFTGLQTSVPFGKSGGRFRKSTPRMVAIRKPHTPGKPSSVEKTTPSGDKGSQTARGTLPSIVVGNGKNNSSSENNNGAKTARVPSSSKRNGALRGDKDNDELTPTNSPEPGPRGPSPLTSVNRKKKRLLSSQNRKKSPMRNGMSPMRGSIHGNSDLQVWLNSMLKSSVQRNNKSVGSPQHAHHHTPERAGQFGVLSSLVMNGSPR